MASASRSDIEKNEGKSKGHLGGCFNNPGGIMVMVAWTMIMTVEVVRIDQNMDIS